MQELVKHDRPNSSSQETISSSKSEVDSTFSFRGKGPFLDTRIYRKAIVPLVTFITQYANRVK